MSDLAARIDALDWARIGADLDAYGAAATGVLLTPAECAELVAGDDVPAAFRSRVVMARHGLRRSC